MGASLCLNAVSILGEGSEQNTAYVKSHDFLTMGCVSLARSARWNIAQPISTGKGGGGNEG